MFNGRQISDKKKKPHERALRIVYNDTVTSLENLLVKDKSFTIHQKNIQSSAIEIYKAINNLSGGNLREFFIGNNHNCNLRSRSELSLSNVNTAFKGQSSISYFGSGLWNSIPYELRIASSYHIFRSEIENYAKINSPGRIEAINTLVIPVATYIFNIINLTIPET